MKGVAAALIALTLAAWAYWIIAAILVRRFFQTPFETRAEWPPVSLLKPVKGLDPEMFENFASFCRQDYPEMELVFGVDDPFDPAVAEIARLKRAFPHVSMRLVVARTRGTNRKAALLHELAQAARHEVLVASDSDMRVTPDYLRRVVAPLSDPDTGLVTCPYRGAAAASLFARLEALHMGVVFLPAVVVARHVLRMRFAMGATVALRRRDLEAIGGFRAVSEHLADDYQLGSRLAALGRKVELSRYVVQSVLGSTSARQGLSRELRWARCTRVSQAGGYLGYGLTFPTPLALLCLVALGGSAFGWALLTGSLALRWMVASAIAKSTNDTTSLEALLLLPLRDLQTAAVWVAGAFGRRVTWRDETYPLTADGRLRRASPTRARLPVRIAQLRASRGVPR